jgi:hypothetical protein
MWWLLGCYEGPQLSDEWYLDRLRLLGVRAEPAEPRPGDVVSFVSLSYVPGGGPASLAWFACLDGERSGCVDDPDELELDDLTPEQLAELLEQAQASGLIGLEPGVPPVWTVPEDALYGVDSEDLREGVVATVQLALVSADELELGVRLLPVSFASTPNHNPVLAELLADGEPLSSGVLVAPAGAEVQLQASVVGGPEIYEYVLTRRGVPALELRTEELQWRWYTDVGELDESGGRKDPAVGRASWQAPSDPVEGVLHVVVLDGRGGMGWQTLIIRTY